MHIFRVSIFKPSELISKKTDSERELSGQKFLLPKREDMSSNPQSTCKSWL